MIESSIGPGLKYRMRNRRVHVIPGSGHNWILRYVRWDQPLEGKPRRYGRSIQTIALSDEALRATLALYEILSGVDREGKCG